MSTPALESTAAVQLPDYVADLAWHPDGELVALACADGSVHEMLPEGNASAPVLHHDGGACAVAYAPDGTLASAGEDGRVAIGARPPQPAGAGWVELLAWSPRGELLATAVGRRVQTWTLDGELVAESAAQPSTVEAMAWSPDGSVLVAGGHGGLALLGPDAQPVAERLEFPGVVLSLAWAPDGLRLACGMQDVSVWLWNIGTRQAATMSGMARKVRELAWNADGTVLVSGGGSVPVAWHLEEGSVQASGQAELQNGHQAAVSWLGFQPGGGYLASAGEDGLVVLWDPPISGPLTGATVGEAVGACAWSPDGTRLAIGGRTGRAAVFSLQA